MSITPQGRFSGMVTPCGIIAHGRPCQAMRKSERSNYAFPFAYICAAPGETVATYLSAENRERLSPFLNDLGTVSEVVGLESEGFDRILAMIQSRCSGCIVIDGSLSLNDLVYLSRFLDRYGRIIILYLHSAGSPVPMTGVHPAIRIVDAALAPLALAEQISRSIGAARKNACFQASCEEAVAAVSQLSERELIVARMIAGGRTLKDIAFVQGRSYNTIKVQRARILDKLGVESDVQLSRAVDIYELAEFHGVAKAD